MEWDQVSSTTESKIISSAMKQSVKTYSDIGHSKCICGDRSRGNGQWLTNNHNHDLNDRLLTFCVSWIQDTPTINSDVCWKFMTWFCLDCKALMEDRRKYWSLEIGRNSQRTTSDISWGVSGVVISLGTVAIRLCMLLSVELSSNSHLQILFNSS